MHLCVLLQSPAHVLVLCVACKCVLYTMPSLLPWSPWPALDWQCSKRLKTAPHCVSLHAWQISYKEFIFAANKDREQEQERRTK
jgi:hypothetical protein